MHIHILGICGTFMGGIALLARAAGHRVTGCDANVYPPMSTQLMEQGIELIEGFDAGQMRLAPDLFVIGNALSRGNPLVEAILDTGAAYTSGPQWLADNLLRERWVLAVAGTHGKTTTTALLAWILEEAGLAPSFLVGGVPYGFGVSARLTPRERSPFFVIEADEYDTAFFDKRSKFVHYRPRTAILNNLEFDHADIFADLAAIETQFHHFVRTVPQSGLIVAHSGDAALTRTLGRGCWTPIESFGTDNAWQAGRPNADGGFAVRHRGADTGEVARFTLPGEHNRLNALAALLAARHAGVSLDVGLAALARFPGVRRRLEVRGRAAGVTVYDDFAHHPTAIRVTIDGLRERIGAGERILAVFEPRSNTMKRGVQAGELPAALAGADAVFLFADRLGWDAAAMLAPLGPRAHVESSFDRLVDAVVCACRPGDHVLVMSNGGFGGIHGRLLDALGARRGTT